MSKILMGGSVMLLGYAYWMGVFANIPVTDESFEGAELLYKPYQGPYGRELGEEFRKNTVNIKKNPLAEKVYNERGALGVGVYYDDPNRVEDSNKLRGDIGFLLDTKSLNLDEKRELLDDFAQLGYNYTVLPKAKSFKATFPVRFPKVFSYILSAWKFNQAFTPVIKADLDYLETMKNSTGFIGLQTFDSTEITFYIIKENLAEFYLTKFENPKIKPEQIYL